MEREDPTPEVSPPDVWQPEESSPEMAELQAVLNSGIFARAPGLASLLQYVCEKQIAGEGHLIKEYNIAVEALGRPDDFDQKRDSIVRVEAHRLRKRLKEYYEKQGANHHVRIELPAGGYAPVFVRNGQPAVEEAGKQEIAAEEYAEPPVSDEEVNSRRPKMAVWLAAGLVALVAIFVLGRRASAPQAVTAEQVSLAGAAALSEVRIAAGGAAALADSDGRAWAADRYFKGGAERADAKLEAQGTLKPQIFQTWREGSFSYAIPLKPGVYELMLYFCEPELGTGEETSRLFDIRVNGKAVAEEFDVLAEAGAPRTVLAKSYKDVRPQENGILSLEFSPRRNKAILSAIEVSPGSPGKLRPIRIAAREGAYTDSAGRIFLPDRFFRGGRLVRRVEEITGTEDPELYRGERYGRLTYAIPVPSDSTYTVVVHLAETWFGGTGGGGPGGRIFDILCNGVVLDRNLDVYQAAGGAFRAIRRTYRGVKPSPDGKLDLQFVPSKNYAFVNAIEVLDEAGSK